MWNVPLLRSDGQNALGREVEDGSEVVLAGYNPLAELTIKQDPCLAKTLKHNPLFDILV